MFTESQRDHIINYKDERALAEKKADMKKFDSSRQMNKRIREKIRTALDDITLYAQYMPEDQLKQVFTADELKPLFVALTDPKHTLQVNEKDNKLKNQRVFEICYLMEELGIQNGFVQLSDDIQKTFLTGLPYKYAVTPVRSIGMWTCGNLIM